MPASPLQPKCFLGSEARHLQWIIGLLSEDSTDETPEQHLQTASKPKPHSQELADRQREALRLKIQPEPRLGFYLSSGIHNGHDVDFGTFQTGGKAREKSNTHTHTHTHERTHVEITLIQYACICIHTYIYIYIHTHVYVVQGPGGLDQRAQLPLCGYDFASQKPEDRGLASFGLWLAAPRDGQF